MACKPSSNPGYCQTWFKNKADGATINLLLKILILGNLMFLKWVVSKSATCPKERHYLNFPRLFTIRTSLKRISETKDTSTSAHKAFRSETHGRIVCKQHPPSFLHHLGFRRLFLWVWYSLGYTNQCNQEWLGPNPSCQSQHTLRVLLKEF